MESVVNLTNYPESVTSYSKWPPTMKQVLCELTTGKLCLVLCCTCIGVGSGHSTPDHNSNSPWPWHPMLTLGLNIHVCVTVWVDDSCHARSPSIHGIGHYTAVPRPCTHHKGMKVCTCQWHCFLRKECVTYYMSMYVCMCDTFTYYITWTPV
jgi:hypothetical protein